MMGLFFLIVSVIFFAISVTCFFKFLDHDFSPLDEEDDKTARRYWMGEIIFMCLGIIALTACCASMWYYYFYFIRSDNMFFDPGHANNQLHHKFYSSNGYGSGGGHGFCGGGGVSQLYDKNGKRIKGKKKTRSDGELSDSRKD